MKMRIKIMILFLCSTLFILLLQGLVFESKSSEIIYEQSKESTMDKLKNMQNEFCIQMKSVENNLIKIYNEENFMDDLKKEKSIDYLRENYKNKASKFVSDKIPLSFSPDIVAMYIYDGNFDLISNYRRLTSPTSGVPKDIFQDGDKYNSEVLKKYINRDNRLMFISSYYIENKKENIVRVAIKISNRSNKNKVLGFLVCDMKSKEFTKITNKYCNEKDMLMWIQPLGDRPVVSAGSLEDQSADYYNKNIEKINAGFIGDVNTLEKGNKVIFKVPVDNYNLDAYSIISQSYLKENQNSLNKYLIISLLCMSIAIVILSLIESKIISGPIEKLTLAMNMVKRGHMNERVKYKSKDEIGILAENFNEMLDKIEELISSEYEAKLLSNKAQYAALQSQINPHFLYNTLDTMESIASIQNCTSISNMCEALSNMFRYNLDLKDPNSTVGKEISHLKNYIYLMNIRMNGEVEYQFDIDNEVLECVLPKISIQPLVENSLKHGLKNKRGDKKIYISAHEAQDELQIIVEDNGVGMDAEKINDTLKNSKKNVFDNSTSIGLLNIDSRMKILYGDEFGLYVESDQGVGSKVILRIPKLKRNGEDNV